MVLEIIGAFFIIMGTTLFGFWWAANYKRRMEELEQLEYLMHMLYGEIKYQVGNFSESFFSIGRHCSGRIQQFSVELAEVLEEGNGESFCTIWRKMVEIHWTNSALSEDDRNSLIALGEKLGYLDKEMQLNTIQLFMNQMEQKKQMLQQVMPEKCRISRLIGVLSGIFITILLL